MQPMQLRQAGIFLCEKEGAKRFPPLLSLKGAEEQSGEHTVRGTDRERNE